jgi:hypothetical protein
MKCAFDRWLEMVPYPLLCKGAKFEAPTRLPLSPETRVGRIHELIMEVEPRWRNNLPCPKGFDVQEYVKAKVEERLNNAAIY